MPKGVPLEPGERAPRRPRRGPPARVRRVRGRDPEGRSTAPARSRSGTRGTYELVEEKRDGGLTVRLHGERLEGSGRSCRRTSTATRRTGCSCASATTAPRPSGPARVRSRCSPRSPSELPAGEGWLFEVKWDGYRALAHLRGGEVDAREPQRQRPHGALRRRRAGAAPGASQRPTASSTARSARSTRRAGRASPRCSRASRGRRRLLRLRPARARRRAARRPAARRAARAARALLDGRDRGPCALGDVRRRRGAARGGATSRGSRASWPSGPTRATSRASARATG